jgi:hypothetical protein
MVSAGRWLAQLHAAPADLERESLAILDQCQKHVAISGTVEGLLGQLFRGLVV